MTESIRKTAKAILKLPDNECIYLDDTICPDEMDLSRVKALAQAYLDAAGIEEDDWNHEAFPREAD